MEQVMALNYQIIRQQAQIMRLLQEQIAILHQLAIIQNQRTRQQVRIKPLRIQQLTVAVHLASIMAVFQILQFRTTARAPLKATLPPLQPLPPQQTKPQAATVRAQKDYLQTRQSPIVLPTTVQER